MGTKEVAPDAELLTHGFRSQRFPLRFLGLSIGCFTNTNNKPTPSGYLLGIITVCWASANSCLSCCSCNDCRAKGKVGVWLLERGEMDTTCTGQSICSWDSRHPGLLPICYITLHRSPWCFFASISFTKNGKNSHILQRCTWNYLTIGQYFENIKSKISARAGTPKTCGFLNEAAGCICLSFFLL